MTSGQKIAFSLLTTIILVTGFVITAQSTNLFKILDDRYYSQTQVKEKNEHLNGVAKSLDSYITNVLTQLEKGEKAYVKQDCVRSYMDQNPSEALQQERRDLTAQLFNDIPALSGIRLVDKNGKSLHYSSYDNDVLKINGSYKTYKNYTDVVKDSDELDFNLIKVNENSPVRRVLLDSDKNRIIAAIPFNWIGDVYSGTMFFYFNFKDVEQALLRDKAITYGENIKLISDGFAGGIVVNLPNIDQKDFLDPVVDLWKKSKTVKSPQKILEMQDGRFWLMLSDAECEYAAVAGVYTSDVFQLPQELIWVIYGCIAVTVFLISFLLFSLKRNSEAVIKRRLKKIQYGIIKEYLDNKEKIEWSSVVKQLKTRKDDLSGDIYSSLGVHSKKQKKHLDEFLEKSWAEIFEILEGTKNDGVTMGTGTNVPQSTGNAGITMEQLRNMLEEVLQETSLNINVANVKSVKSSVISQQPSAVVEEVEELDDVEAVEELDDVEEIADAEAVEELDDVEEIEDVEELDDVEDVEEVEELDDVEDVEEVEELNDVEEAEEVEELTDDEEIADAEEINDTADDVEEVEEFEAAEEIPLAAENSELSEPEEKITEIGGIEVVEELEGVSETKNVTDQLNVPENSIKFAQSLNPIGYQYVESNETFIRSDLFASTSDVFAEELSLGPEYVEAQVPYVPLDFIIYDLPKLAEASVETEESVEEDSEVPTVESLMTKGTGSTATNVTKVPESTVTKSEQPYVAAPVAVKVEEHPKSAPKKARLGLLAAASAIVNNELTLKDNPAGEDVEELKSTEDYSMAQFGANEVPVQDLEIAQESIVEKEDGLYEIAEDLEYSQVNLDKSFQSLVDSVLK